MRAKPISDPLLVRPAPIATTHGFQFNRRKNNKRLNF
jgi:hypothetical protein